MSCECLGSSPNESSLLIFIVLFFTRLFKCIHRRHFGTNLSREAYFKNATTKIYCVNMSEYDNNELDHGCKVNFTLLTAIF
jgi:hypothetical protein